jgi:hypothetical protein
MPCQCDSSRVAPISYAEVLARCESARLQVDLFKIYSNAHTWSEVLLCSSCRTVYIGERPFSIEHGGGPLCLFISPVADAEQWVREGNVISARLVAEHQARGSQEPVGDEVDP